MISFFTCPKKFDGHLDVIQRNAINSWLSLDPIPEVILLGNDEGVKEFAEEKNIKYCPDIEKYGSRSLPLISSIFQKGQELSSNPFCCWINSDIILPKELPEIVKTISSFFQDKPFLIVGERTSVNILNKIDFSNDIQIKSIFNKAKSEGASDGIWAIDYFIFPKGMYKEIPPFAIGCSCYDNWLIAYAKENSIPIINTSRIITVIHQNHDHLSKGGFVSSFSGEDAQRNQRLAVGKKCNLADADFIYDINSGISKPEESDKKQCDLQEFMQNLVRQAEAEFFRGDKRACKDTLSHVTFCNEKPNEHLQERINILYEGM